MPPNEQDRPRFSIISAVYNVSRYLPDFIGSLDSQDLPADRFEVIAVDDGSTDDSLALLQTWAERAPYRVTVLTKPNGGQASARNLGMTRAVGEWVTFTDPDDILDPRYLSAVDAFLEAHTDVKLIATNRILFYEAEGRESDSHPLKRHFAAGDKLVSLDSQPEFFHGSAPAAFLRAGHIASQSLRFDERIRPNFEDGHFCANYLLTCSDRSVGFVASARYLYRKRADQTSTLQNSLQDPRRYTDVPRLGYLDIMERSLRAFGAVPEWLQNLIIYELSWYLSAEEASNSTVTAAFGDVADSFHELMEQIAPLLEPQVVRAFRLRHLSAVSRELLLHAWSAADWCTPYAVVDNVDHRRGLVQVLFRYVGTAPRAEYLIDGTPARPRHEKARSITYFDRQLMVEHIAWVSSRGTLRVLIDGVVVPLRGGFDGVAPTSRDFPVSGAAPGLAGARDLVARARRRAERELITGRGRRLVMGPRREFDEAWVFVDRIHDADDNAEILFRYVREHRPDINAWFCIERGTPDWDRLRRDGYGDRLIDWGSTRWRALMASCDFLVSSHIDEPIHRPLQLRDLVQPRWRFIFLQHGIIKDDLSNWLNSKKIDLFVTSTRAEYASIAGDHTGYKFTTREVRNTGLPRFDSLLEAGAKYPPDRRDLVVVAPTWRNWLLPPLASGSQRRVLPDGFWESDYCRNWLGLLSSERLADEVRAQGLRLGFLPHPNLQSILDSGDLPGYVVPLRFVGEDVRTHFARAAALITDYSSMAFNAAYLDRPVTYFQFDAKLMFGGGHVGRGGYFDYDTQGLGPVSHDLEAAVDDLIGVLRHGRDPAPVYAERIRWTFPQRDGRACERLVAEIEELRRPLTISEAGVPVSTPGPPIP